MFEETKPPRQFYETIVDAIALCSGPSTGEIARMLKLISETVIEADHDKIVSAIDGYFLSFAPTKWACEVRVAKEHLASQKALAEQKRSARKIERGERVLIKSEPIAHSFDFDLAKGVQEFILYPELAGQNATVIGISCRYNPKNEWKPEEGEITVRLDNGSEWVVKESHLQLA